MAASSETPESIFSGVLFWLIAESSTSPVPAETMCGIGQEKLRRIMRCATPPPCGSHFGLPPCGSYFGLSVLEYGATNKDD